MTYKLLVIWAPCGSGEGADGLGGIWGHGGVSLDMCTHMCMHTHARNTKINMLGNCKWPPPWRQPCLSCLTCMHVCAHVHAHVCMHMHTCVGVPPPNPTPIHPPPRCGTPQISKNAIRLERIEIFRFCLKIWNLWRIPHLWVGVFRWFKFTLKPPNRITCDKLRLAIWDTSFWTFWVKFGHNGPWDIS